MRRTGFVIGNGTSRRKFDLNNLIDRGLIYACNAVYREFCPNVLVAVDPKMIHEIVGANFQYECEVWTNYNKAFEKYVGLNYFNPNKGWSSGPTALYKAVLDGCQDIYTLGFDFVGLENGARVNNIYAGSKNYKARHEPATYYGNWLRQTETIIRENSDRRFIRVMQKDDFVPNNLNQYSNFTNITYKEFNNRIDK